MQLHMNYILACLRSHQSLIEVQPYTTVNVFLWLVLVRDLNCSLHVKLCNWDEVTSTSPQIKKM
jgi:hypothetical protein